MAEPNPKEWEQLSPETVEHVARLARLKLSKSELEAMAFDLARILVYVSQLKSVNTEGVEPLAHALDMTNVFRDDELTPSLPVNEALANAPRRQQDFFSVPAVLD